jgi:tRNA threonylcarbamoyladenosine biosynthesis protein TsaE
MNEFLLADCEATEKLGALLASQLPHGAVVFLHGDLGAGKTTLVRGFLRAIGVIGPVKSPTYTLVEPYQLPQVTVNHFDLYRICDAQELELIGIRDYVDDSQICFFEWPERGGTLLPLPSVQIFLQPREQARIVHLTGDWYENGDFDDKLRDNFDKIR